MSSSADHGTLRQDAFACLRAAIQAVDPARLVLEHLSQRPEMTGRVYLAGLGKAAGAMAVGARAALGEQLADGVLIVPDNVNIQALPGVRAFRAGHPIPDDRGVRAALSMLQMAERLQKDDVLLCALSGGGSSLMTLPSEGVTLEEVRQTTDLLLRAGATIQELNCVRKRLDRLKGGRLARAAAPARVVALVLSDVVGDPLDVIASGPISPDSTTFETAVHLLKNRSLWTQVPDAVRRHLVRGLDGQADESPALGDPCFQGVEARVVGNNRLAAEAARGEAQRRGYQTRLLSTSITGEAREVGSALAALGREMRHGDPLGLPGCVVAGGETTVTVQGTGKGGPNQELALGAALALDGEPGILLASVGTDGIDGPTDAAGAFADGSTVERARAAGLDPAAALTRNDSYPFFQALGDLVMTGPTGTNVMDLHIILVREAQSAAATGAPMDPS